jgi:DNA end-binding protein Ku
MPRYAFWKGQTRISLVTLPVQVIPATKRVLASGKPVRDADIIKGYEYAKGETILLEPKEIDEIKLASSDGLELTHFVDVKELPVLRLERPYFVVPDGKKADEIYQVIESLRASGKAGIGQISLRGREELCAVMALEHGLVVETLRYDIELQDMPAIFRKASSKANGEYLSLARKLIEEKSGPASFGQYYDHYHEALRELIEAKRHHRAARIRTPDEKPKKVVDFMDALKRSLKFGKRTPPQAAEAKRKAPRAKGKARRRHAA